MILYLSLTVLLAGSFAYFTKEKEELEIEVVAAPPIQKKQISTGKKTENEETNAEVNQIRRFFSKGVDKFPFIKTITYSSRVPWLKGRPAWIADYASYYQTSRHFIARSLNGKEDYVSQNVSSGATFNVIDPEKDIEFHLLADLSKCTLDFSYLDKETNEQVLIRSYPIGVGRKDEYSPSGCLTPLGTFKLGEKIAIYKEGVENYYQNKKTHMIEVFGKRWIPFGEEVADCTDNAKGYGLHGLPFVRNGTTDEFVEDLSCLGKYSSDGCIRLTERDMNELFAIIITKPTFIKIVKERGSNDFIRGN